MADKENTQNIEGELETESGFATATASEALTEEKPDETTTNDRGTMPEYDDTDETMEAGFGLATTTADSDEPDETETEADREAKAAAEELEQQAHDNLNDFLKSLATVYKIDVTDFDSMTMPDGKTPAKPLLQAYEQVSFERQNLIGARTLVAKKKNGSGAEIKIKHDKKTGGPRITTKGLTMEKALEMAVLAAANPKMQKNGVTLFGSPEQQQILAAAAAAVGLKVAGEAPQLSDELKAQAAATFQGMNWNPAAEEPKKEPEAVAAEETENAEATKEETAEAETAEAETVEEEAAKPVEVEAEAETEEKTAEQNAETAEASEEKAAEESGYDAAEAVAKAKDLLKRSFVLQGYQELSDEQINQYWDEELSEDHKKNLLDNLDNFEKEISESEQEAKEHAEKLKTMEALSYDDLEQHLETLESETPVAERLAQINELIDGSVGIKHVDVPENIDRKEAWDKLNADDRLYFIEAPGEAAKTIAQIESYRDITLDKLKEDNADLHKEISDNLLKADGATEENIGSRWDEMAPIDKSRTVNMAQRALQQLMIQNLAKPLAEQDDATKDYFAKMYITDDGPATEEQLEESWKAMPLESKQYIQQQAAFMASMEAAQNQSAAPEQKAETAEAPEATEQADTKELPEAKEEQQAEAEAEEPPKTDKTPDATDEASPPSLSATFNQLSDEGREMLLAEAKKHGKLPMNEEIYNAVAKAVLESTEHNGTVRFSSVKRAYHEAAGLSANDESRPRDKRVAKNPSAITGAKIIQEVMANEGLLTKKGNRHYEINKNRNAPGGTP